MRDPGILTVIAKVDPARFEALKKHLRQNVNPDEKGTRKELTFESYPNLHFLSFCMPEHQPDPKGDPDKDMPGQLVMEATFDGPEDAFIRDLVHRDLDGLIGIFSYCPDFPVRARENPHLIEIYLKQHALPAPTYFSGAPGKTVAQIKGEQTMRRKLGAILRAAPAKLLTAEPRRLHDHLRREALKDEALCQMSQPPEPPWSLINGDRMMRLVGYVLLLPVLMIGAVIFCSDAVGAGWLWLASHDLIGGALRLATASLILLWIFKLQDEAGRAGKRVNPEAMPFVMAGITGAAALIVKILMSIVAIQMLFDLARGVESALWPSLPWPVAHELVVFVAIIVSLALFLVAGLYTAYLGGIRASVGRLQRADRRPPEAPLKWRERWRAFMVFWLVYILACLPVATILVAVPGPKTILIAGHLWSCAVLVSGWFIAGLIVIIMVWVLGLKLHDWLQRRENRPFSDPLRLYDRPLDDPDRWAREEHGYNRRQNHYVSLTTIKGGALRRWLVMLALTVVNFIARYKDNKGDLGGIPTIFSARWALIDNGRRLLFMTNYSGAWDSYLNEFSELASVIGVNLIWTNTYIAPTRPEHRAGIYFPETALYTGKGARATLPFKAYVRQSQLETLVWYGAYRDLSVVNVIDNSKIRKAVFGPPDAAALDLLLKRL